MPVVLDGVTKRILSSMLGKKISEIESHFFVLWDVTSKCKKKKE